MIPIWSVISQVNDKILRVIISPLTHHTVSNSLKTSSSQHPRLVPSRGESVATPISLSEARSLPPLGASFSKGQWLALNTKSLHWRQMIHGRQLLKKNQILLKGLRDWLSDWSKRHCIYEKDFQGRRWPLFAKKMPNDGSCIASHLLNSQTTKELVLRPFYASWTTMGTNLCQPPRRSVQSICSLPLPCELPPEERSLPFVSYVYANWCSIYLVELEGGSSLWHLYGINFLRAT